MGYPVTNTLSTLFPRHTYISSDGLGLNMRCFVCNKRTITKYGPGIVFKRCADIENCDWESYPTKIPEAIK